MGADPGQALLGEGSHQNPSEQFGAKTAPPLSPHKWGEGMLQRIGNMAFDAFPKRARPTIVSYAIALQDEEEVRMALAYCRLQLAPQ